MLHPQPRDYYNEQNIFNHTHILFEDFGQLLSTVHVSYNTQGMLFSHCCYYSILFKKSTARSLGSQVSFTQSAQMKPTRQEQHNAHYW